MIALPSHITFKDVYTFYDVAAISSRAIQCLQFHLGEVLGMARWYNRFGVLGLSEAAVQGTGYDCLDNKRDLFKIACHSFTDCINHLGTFALKSQELLL